MHDYAENMARLRYDGVKGKNHPHGKNYGLICTCITGSTKFPKLSTVFWILPAYKTTLGPIISTRQSRLSVVSRFDQFKTALDQPPHYVLRVKMG